MLLMFTVIIACGRQAEKRNSNPAVETPATNPSKDSSSDQSRTIHIDAGSTVSADTIPSIDLEPRLKEIAKADYEKYSKAYRTACPLDSNDFIKGSGLSLESSCDEVCQTFLIERKSGKRMELYADFDQGLPGLRVSPSCNRFITYSSYDGHDYDKYYRNRAIITSYEVTDKSVPFTVKRTFIYTVNQWSIDAVTWIDNNSVALKMYSEELTGNGSDLHYQYYKTTL